MASLEGLKIGIELAKKGWKYAQMPIGYYGNPNMICPETGEHCSVIEAKKIQDEKEKKSKINSLSCSGIYLDVFGPISG